MMMEIVFDSEGLVTQSERFDPHHESGGSGFEDNFESSLVVESRWDSLLFWLVWLCVVCECCLRPTIERNER